MQKRLMVKGRFLTTQWQVVRQASASPTQEQIEALDRLLRTYCPALIEFLRRRFNFTVHQAEDVVQCFVRDQILIKNILATASSERGRFRTFLLNSLQNYTYDRLRKERARSRRPLNGFSPLDEVANDSNDLEPDGPQRLFDDLFGRQILAEAIRRTHQHCLEIQKPEIWEILHSRILSPHLSTEPAISYPVLVQELGLKNHAEAQNRLATGKRIFKRFFQAVVEEFSTDHSEFEEELQYFQKFFATSGQDPTP